MYNFTVPGWHPTPLNKFVGRHWSVGHKAKTLDANMIHIHGKMHAGIPVAELKRRVSIEITLAPRQRACDPDAYWKSLLDGLVACGLLRDDSNKWCELGKVRFFRGAAKCTRIILEDI